MTLIKRNNMHPFDDLFNSFFSDEPANWSVGYNRGFRNRAAVNIYETDEDYRLEMMAPGFEKEQFKVELENDELIIRAERENQQEVDNKHYSHREFQMANVERRFNLPEGKVDPEKVSAEYRNGVLNIVLAKREEHKPAPSRMIEIR